MVWINPESRRKYLATRSSIRLYAHTADSFACSRLLALLTPSAALTRSLARSLRSLPRLWDSEFFMSQNDLVLSHRALPDEEALPSLIRQLTSNSPLYFYHAIQYFRNRIALLDCNGITGS